VRARLVPVVAALAAFFAAGCGAGEETIAAEEPAFEGVPWLMAAGLDLDGLENGVPSLRFEAGKLGGFSGCNDYGGPYVAGPRAIEIPVEQLFSTAIGCQPPASDVESAFHEALGRVEAWRVEADELVLLDGRDDELLRFEIATPVGSWFLLDWIEQPLPGTRVTATFSPDGKLTGSAGCNSYGGSYTSDRGALEISEIAKTDMLCKGPAGVMEQETKFLEALASATEYSVNNEVLYLRRADGKPVAYLSGRSG
jgi:heat shock protein HslJ